MEYIYHLKGSAQSLSHPSMNRFIGYVTSLKQDLARILGQKTSQDIDQGRFAGAVGSDY